VFGLKNVIAGAQTPLGGTEEELLEVVWPFVTVIVMRSATLGASLTWTLEWGTSAVEKRIKLDNQLL
jgi:hypothetical protein